MKAQAIALALLLASCQAPASSQSDPQTRPRMRVTDRVKMPGGIQTIAAGAGSIWVAIDEFDDLLRLDPTSGEVVARIRYKGRYSGASQLAFSGTDVWAAAPGGASPPGGFDPDSDPEPWLVKAYENFRLRTADLLEEETAGGIVRIDAGTNRVRKEMLFLDYNPVSIVVTDTGPVVPTERGLRRIEPDTYRFGPPRGERRLSFALASEVGIWAHTSSQIVLFDAVSLEEKLVISRRDVRVPDTFDDISYDDGVLWVLTHLEILKIDASSGAVLARTDIQSLSDIEVSDGVILVEETYTGDLQRIDPMTLEMTDTLDLPDNDIEAYGLVIVDGAAWIAHGLSVLRISLP